MQNLKERDVPVSNLNALQSGIEVEKISNELKLYKQTLQNLIINNIIEILSKVTIIETQGIIKSKTG